MKRPFTIYDSRFTIWKKSAASAAVNPQSAIRNHKYQQGVALIITLILLAVVTFMAITFLAISRRERNAVTTVTDTASAKLAADAALANAEAQIIANAFANTNPFSFGLIVSTNYINPAGFTNGSYNDVSYQDNRGTNLYNESPPDNFLAMLTNLWYDPRPPVFVTTNPGAPLDFRFYLDLNRNGRFDPNDLEPVMSPNPAKPYYDLNGNEETYTPPTVLSNIMVGDPEWVGVLERPDAPHGPNNHFIARYAFIAVPVGNTLDLNAVHNNARMADPAASASSDDGFFRDQGVGSWEINLASFLADLNTNQWYENPSTLASYYDYEPFYKSGPLAEYRAFDDALALLNYRYNTNYLNLAWVQNLFINVSQQAAFRNSIDGYGFGPLMTNLWGANYFPNLNLPWAGADNTNHFFTHQELFDPTKAGTGVSPANIALGLDFPNHLFQTGTNISTYDRYTYYRMLSQLGTDSTPDDGKMNLNYSNALVLYDSYGVATNYSIIPGAETNFVSWRPLDFFTVAADRLLRTYTTEWRNSSPTNFAIEFYASQAYTTFTNADQWTNFPPFGIGHIPVLISNQFVYSPAVNRLLQLAANMYDATTNNTYALGMNYPSVFRPVFWVTNEPLGSPFKNVYIIGYQAVGAGSGNSFVMGEVFGGTSNFQLASPLDVTALPIGSSVVVNYSPYNAPGYTYNVYGVPWIIGAKKGMTNGFPTFNKFAMQNVVSITRKLQIKRNTLSTPVNPSLSNFDYTNQLYVFSVSNSLGMDYWNSYSNAYPNPVQIVVNDNLSMQLTNDLPGAPQWNGNPPTYSANTNVILAGAWPGTAPWSPSGPNSSSFQMPLNTTYQFLMNSDFYFGQGNAGNYTGFAQTALNWGWDTNKVNCSVPLPHFGLLTTNRLQAFMLDSNHIIDYVQFAGPDSSRDLNAEIAANATSAAYPNMWATNLDNNGIPLGIISQIEASDGLLNRDSSYWDDSLADDEINGFSVFIGFGIANGVANGSSTAADYTNRYIVQVPYTPTVTTYLYTSWQANDPLVHYLTTDLNFYGQEAGGNGPITGTNVLSYPKSPIPRPSFNALNERYQPWSMINELSRYTSLVDQNPSSLAYKDPLVRLSDNWDFPTNKLPTVGWLGRVHRGTPWQSVFLKATNILNWAQTEPPYENGINTWEFWTGNFDFRTVSWAAPYEDRLLFDLFTTALNENATRGTLSINVGAGLTNNPVAGLAAWSALFSGLVTVSNNAPDLAINPRFAPQSQTQPPFYTATNIFQPAGAYYNPALSLPLQPALVQIVNGINSTRANTNLFQLGAFAHVGDILAVPQLTEQSPFLHWYNWNGGNPVYDGVQITNGISDEMYEWLPQQALSLLRCSSSPRYVIYCYGQALKPAPNGIYTGGNQFFGLVTNYQVVAETAARAVVRFNSMVTNVITGTPIVIGGVTNWNWTTVPVVTNNSAVIEQFNVLPPD